MLDLKPSDLKSPKVREIMRGMGLYQDPTKKTLLLRLHYTADPTITKEQINYLRREVYNTDAKWQQEMEINPRAGMGARVYPEFERGVHVLPASAIPKKLCMWMACDPHPRTPHAFLWIGVDRFGDKYIVREYWPSIAYGTMRRLKDSEKENTFTTKQYVEAVAKLEGNKIEWMYQDGRVDPLGGFYQELSGGENVMRRYMDQAGKGFLATGEGALEESYAKRYKRYGLNFSDPKKAHQAGEDAVREGLIPRPHDLFGMKPALMVSDDCPETALEFENTRYGDTRNSEKEEDQNQKVNKFRTHMMDLTRYIMTKRPYYHADWAVEWQRRFI